MRVSNLMMANNFIHHVQETQERINTTNEQLASGKLFQTPSEDPIRASLSMQLKSSLRVSMGYQSTAEMASEWMSATDTSLAQLEKIATQAVNTVVSGLNGTINVTERQSFATELTIMINHAVDIGNSKYQDSYIFSGARTDHPAFELEDPSIVAYKGISKALTRNIGQDSKVTINVGGETTILPLIQEMIKARDYLAANNTDDLPASLTNLKSALNNLVAAHTETGTRMRQVKTGIEGLEKSVAGIKTLLNKKEDTSLSEAITMLENQQMTYQAVLEVGSRTISALNLFDYLH